MKYSNITRRSTLTALGAVCAVKPALSTLEGEYVNNSKRITLLPTFQVPGSLFKYVNTNINSKTPEETVTNLNLAMFRQHYSKLLQDLNLTYAAIAKQLEDQPQTTIATKNGDENSWGYFVPWPNAEYCRDIWNLTGKRVVEIFARSQRIYNPSIDVQSEDIDRIHQIIFSKNPLGYILMRSPELLNTRKRLEIPQGDDDGKLKKALADFVSFESILRDLVNLYGFDRETLSFLTDVFANSPSLEERNMKIAKYTRNAVELSNAVEQSDKVPTYVKKQAIELLNSYPEIARTLILRPRRDITKIGEIIAAIDQDLIIVASRPFIKLFTELGYAK